MSRRISRILVPILLSIASFAYAQTWTPQSTNISLIIYEINFADENHGFAVTQHGGSPPQAKILATDNGGELWNVYHSGTVQDLFSVCAASQTHVWTTGETGTIIHTSNGFQSWEYQNCGGNWDLFAVDFIDTLRGWATGDGGIVLHTENGGQNWFVQPTPIGITMRAIDFIDENCGWAGGTGCTIIHTNNGGETWIEQTTPSNLLLYDITFAGALNGWAVGNGGLILHTEDGGRNWSEQESGTNMVLYSIDFVDNMKGWSCGSGGVILHTIDGGENWLQEASGVGSALHSIDFIDAEHGWCCGNLGQMLMYSTPPLPNVSITLIPESPSIVIPVYGGSFSFQALIENHESFEVNLDVWTDALLPDSTVFGPIILRNLILAANSTVTRTLSQYVPGNAPWGGYTYRGFIGIYPSTIWDEDSFNFQKAP